MWKTLGGRCIYESPNGAKVYQNLLYRWLTLGSDAIQTLIHRYRPEYSRLEYIKPLTLAVREQPALCCLLGLGGAGVVHALAPYLDSTQIVVVENNPEVIDIAKTYFMTTQIEQLKIVQQDALEYVKTCSTRFEHLMIDLFDAQSFPPALNNYDFFKRCQRVLSKNGTLAINLANADEHWGVFSYIYDIFEQRTLCLPVKGCSNLIILAYNGGSNQSFLDRLISHAQLKEMYWDARWGCIAHLKV